MSLVRADRSGANYYRDYTDIEHVYYIPDTYVGSIEPTPRVEMAFDAPNKRMVRVNTNLPEGAERVFLEILSNGGDNADDSRRRQVNPGKIDVSTDGFWVKIRNEGEPIPVIPHEKCANDPENLYMIPTHIMQRMRSSSNYDPNIIRMGCGRNGFGAKLTNIFSKYFMLEIGDRKHGQHYRGVWHENMGRLTGQFSEQTVTPGYSWHPQAGGWHPAAGTPYTGPDFVEVTWLLDFERFQIPGYSPEAVALFNRYTVDFSLSCRVPVSFNGVEYDVRAIRDYARLAWDDEIVESAVFHCEWAGGTQPASITGSKKDIERKIALAKTVEEIPSIEILILDTPDAARIFSFVNGLMTVDGGVHVNEVIEQVTPILVDGINAHFARKYLGKKKEKDDKKKKKNKKGKPEKEKKDKDKDFDIPKLTAADVKPHLSMVINCRLPNPKYGSQTKRRLTSPKPTITFSDAFKRSIGDWSLFKRLEDALIAKSKGLFSKSDGMKTKNIYLKKGEDANDAGGIHSQECVLYVVEGKSATGYPKFRIRNSPGGKDRAGYYPIQGKFMNASSNSLFDLEKYQEFKDIKAMWGLRDGVDYTQPGMLETLRYRYFVITTDADADGKHILCLLINLFQVKWPSLLALGLICYLVTPAVRLYQGKRGRTGAKVMARFNSEAEYKKWSAQNPNHRYKVQYYKGLGTSNKEEKAEDLHTAVTVFCFYDENAPQLLGLGFDSKQTDGRKEWMARLRGVTGVDDIVAIPTNPLLAQRSISSIINNDLLQYSLDNLFRAIPSFRDGLKKSQRQGLYHILRHWNYGHSDKDAMKVARIAYAAADKLHYHHGEKSLMDTIIHMAQAFIGSNNLNLLMQQGEFGSRDDGGADAADGRYSETEPEWWIEHVFRKEMVEMIKLREVEGEKVEPYWLPCDVPLMIINGAQGVATGWSTYIPPHNPYQVIEWLLQRMRGEMPAPLIPWFKDFRGTIEIKMRGKRALAAAANADDDESSSDDEAMPGEVDPETNVRLARAEREQDTTTIDETLDLIQSKRRLKGRSLITKGVCQLLATHPDGSQDFHITEIPVGRWMAPWRKWIESEEAEGNIGDHRDNATDVHPDMRIYRAKGYDTMQKLKLVKSYGMSNLVLIDDDGFPRPYETVETMMEAYLQSMLQAYEELRQTRITDLTGKIQWMIAKRHLAHLLVTKQIDFDGKDEEYAYSMLAKHGFDPAMFDKLLDKGSHRSRMKSDFEKSERQIIEENAKLEEMKATSAVQMWSERLVKFRNELAKRRYPYPAAIDPSKYIVSMIGGFPTITALAP